jgi:histidyl-tRNA synthetase
MQKLSTQPYKGARDFYPADMEFRNYIFKIWRETAIKYGYLEYDGPFLEPFELFAAKSGQELVNEQLYSFTDKGERKVAIRPEMTPTLARMVAAQYKTLPRPIRWFSIPNLWRYEKPQRGRLREFFQLNVDIFGVQGIEADFEILSLAIDIMRSFGATSKMFEIRINNRRFMDSMFEQWSFSTEQSFLTKKAIDKMSKISPQDFEKILTEEIKLSQKQQQNLYKLLQEPESALSTPQAKEVNDLLIMLENAGLSEFIKFDPSIMRGLDYYTGNVFEQFDLNPQNTRAMYGGGRYDDLVEIFTNDKLTGIGFGMGDVTLQNFLESWDLLPKQSSQVDYFVCTWPSDSSEFFVASSQLTQEIRQKGKNAILWLDTSTSLDKQLKSASNNNALFTVIIGESELNQGMVTVKNMQDKTQNTITKKEFLQSI